MEADNLDFDTELCLTPGGGRRLSTVGPKRAEMSTASGAAAAVGHVQPKITILYGGRVCICDVTEIQARAIIYMAMKEMEERMKRSGRSSSVGGSLPSAVPQLLNPMLSMKRSLQRFLQKRKNRVSGSEPYNKLQRQQNLQIDSSSSS
ncbi:hypothetical protein HPP92_010821 [Vanilla planifolia]|uniref:Tify domain-containing protein n=1 Tax=Vanilla planifolia TaxID=51239 RepID=A0A835V277_VANPL|nr:hypothetical protein HPP92_011075 [Vanilla planifolia]KAG0482737.1 hypothetical protein HPP92_010821 [Vanilla planifolia]